MVYPYAGGLAPVMIDNSAVLLGSVGFVRNYGPKVAGGIYALNRAQVTASRCAWDNNGLPESLPYVSMFCAMHASYNRKARSAAWSFGTRNPDRNASIIIPPFFRCW
jgi:hypothetical protein